MKKKLLIAALFAVMLCLSACSKEVVFPEKWLVKIPKSLQTAICEILSQDPRPSYQHDPERVYGFYFADLEIRFTVQDSVLTVCSVSEIAKGE